MHTSNACIKLSRMAKGNEFGIWKWIAACAATGLSMIVAEYLNLNHATESVCIFTTLLFAALILFYQDQWDEFRFWRDLLAVFILHIIAASVILQSIASTKWLPGLVMTVGSMIEAAGIIILFDKRSGRSERSENTRN